MAHHTVIRKRIRFHINLKLLFNHPDSFINDPGIIQCLGNLLIRTGRMNMQRDKSDLIIRDLGTSHLTDDFPPFQGNLVLFFKQYLDVRRKRIWYLPLLFRPLCRKRDMVCQREQRVMTDMLKYLLRFLQNSSGGLNIYRLDAVDHFQCGDLLLLRHQRVNLGVFDHFHLFARMFPEADPVSEQNDLPLLLTVQGKNGIVIQYFDNSIHLT